MTQQEQIWQDVTELANRPGTFTHGLGLHVTGIGDGWAEGELTAGDGMLNPLGIVHGGVYAAMMDHVAGTAACSRGSTCRTVNYDLRYLAPAQPGLLRCRAESVRMGQQIVVMQVWVEDAQGVRCAEGWAAPSAASPPNTRTDPSRPIKATLRRWRRWPLCYSLGRLSGNRERRGPPGHMAGGTFSTIKVLSALSRSASCCAW